jgi:hypothetical protein
MILRENTNTVILIDFGLAGNVNSQSLNQAANMAFAPWEQMLETEKSANIDVYTLAASLFYLVTGDTPTPSLARKMSNRDLIEPKQLNSKISDKLNQAIIKGLELEPINRPQSMEKLVALFPNPSRGNNGNDVELKSAVGMDYSKLRDLLKAGNWKEADKETVRVMLAVAKREKEGWLDIHSIDNFPCEDLRIIDKLWLKHSDGKFGFSVQERIYQSLGGTSSYDEKIWQAFGNKVEWRKEGNWLYYNGITFDKKSPEGYLPVGYLGTGRFSGLICKGFVFFSRVETCRLFPVQERQPQIIPTPQPVNQEVQLQSSCGMDYRKLRDLLKAGKWKDADEETTRVILAFAKREKEGWLDVKDIDNFPCEDLRTIDQLWVKYSNGRFGFSVQKRIYQGLGGTKNYNEKIWQAFGDKVGWRKGGSWLYYKDITFDIKAPEGHLPSRMAKLTIKVFSNRIHTIFSRVETCKL